MHIKPKYSGSEYPHKPPKIQFMLLMFTSCLLRKTYTLNTIQHSKWSFVFAYKRTDCHWNFNIRYTAHQTYHHTFCLFFVRFAGLSPDKKYFIRIDHCEATSRIRARVIRFREFEIKSDIPFVCRFGKPAHFELRRFYDPPLLGVVRLPVFLLFTFDGRWFFPRVLCF